MNNSTKDNLDYLTSLSFPEWAEVDALSEWQGELAELDGYLAGLASRVVGGESPDTNMVKQHVARVREALEAIDNVPAEDRAIRADCDNYLSALEKLAQSLCEHSH